MSSTASNPLPAEAWELAAEWLPPNDDPERPQVTLSTVDVDGAPDARTVLLSSFDRDGFAFHTDAASRKVEQITARPLVALTVLWPGFTRQLVVRVGPSPPTTRPSPAPTPPARPICSSWPGSTRTSSRPSPRRAPPTLGRVRHRAPAGLDRAPGWTGYVVRPTRLLFWVSAPDTASRRREWSLGPGGWAHEYRAG